MKKFKTSVLLQRCSRQLVTSISDERPVQVGHEGGPSSHTATVIH